MSLLVLVVPRSRRHCGRAALVGANGRVLAGPFRVLATASARVARRHGNPTRDPSLPFGHPPAGRYLLTDVLPPNVVHPRRPHRFGTSGGIVLRRAQGQPFAASRETIVLHGGPLDMDRRIRPTRGGLRMADADLDALTRALNDAFIRGDPASGLDLVDVPDEQIGTVAASDLRGRRRLLGRARTSNGVVHPMLLTGLGLGVGTNARSRFLGRRAFLHAALLVVGGLTTAACDRASDGPPLLSDCVTDGSTVPCTRSGRGGGAPSPNDAADEDGYVRSGTGVG